MNKKYNKIIFLLFLVVFIIAGSIYKFPQNIWRAKAQTESAIEIPPIIPRSAWLTDDLKKLSDWLPSRDAFPPDYRTVNKIIIHHSAGVNDIPNPIATIQGIYRYHAITQGWLDIGYNYIIDREGRIYEGRMGGNGVRGAHVYDRSDCLNFNYGSIGIVLLGNYTSEEPTEAMYKSAEKLVGWLASVNGLQPDKMAHYSMVWQDKKLPNGACDSSAGGFEYNYYEPVVVGHKDVGATLCPGITNLDRIRKNAAEYAKKVSSFKLRVSGESGILYEIKNGYAEIIEKSLAEKVLPENIAEISQTQLDLFLNKNYFRYSDGKLVRFAGDSGDINLIENGGLRRFESLAAFQKLGFDSGKIIDLPKSDKNLYSSGAPIKYGPDGKLLASGQTVFYIDKGKKSPFTSAQLFESLGYKWTQIEKTSQAALDEILQGEPLRYKAGSLVAVGPTVYELEYKTPEYILRGITSPQLFERLGYKWDKIISILPEEADFYAVGENKRYPENTIVVAKGDPTVFCIKEGERQGFCSAEIFENLGYKWADLLEISKQELDLYVYAGEVKYLEGTLLRYAESPAVYKIQDGKKRPYSSAEEFLKEGNKWEKVLVLKANDLDRYETLGALKFADNAQDKAEAEKSALENEKKPEAADNKNMAGLINPVQDIINNQPAEGAEETDDKKNTQIQDEEKSIQPNGDQAVISSVRVALKSFAKSAGITSATGKYMVKDNASGQIIYAGDAGNIYTMNFSQNCDIEVSSDNNILKIYSIDGVIIDEKNPFHSGYGGVNDNVFAGKIRISYSQVSNKLWIINELSLEDYVKGVAEVSETAPREYLKAMALIIRTYAFYHISNGGKHKGEPFDLKNSLSGNGDDQIFKGAGFSSRAPIFASLVDETAGQIIFYQDKPILAAYSSDSGGVSKDARQVWSSGFFTDKPYLFGGAKDPVSTEHNLSAVFASHGVGLSAAGAKEMAKLGSTFEEIIKHYYPGVEVISND